MWAPLRWIGQKSYTKTTRGWLRSFFTGVTQPRLSDHDGPPTLQLKLWADEAAPCVDAAMLALAPRAGNAGSQWIGKAGGHARAWA